VLKFGNPDQTLFWPSNKEVQDGGKHYMPRGRRKKAFRVLLEQQPFA
jgi:hypothetical protein